MERPVPFSITDAEIDGLRGAPGGTPATFHVEVRNKVGAGEFLEDVGAAEMEDGTWRFNTSSAARVTLQILGLRDHLKVLEPFTAAEQITAHATNSKAPRVVAQCQSKSFGKFDKPRRIKLKVDLPTSKPDPVEERASVGALVETLVQGLTRGADASAPAGADHDVFNALTDALRDVVDDCGCGDQPAASLGVRNPDPSTKDDEVIDTLVRLELARSRPLSSTPAIDALTSRLWDVLGFRVIPDRPGALDAWVELGESTPRTVEYRSAVMQGEPMVVAPLEPPRLRTGRWTVKVLDLQNPETKSVTVRTLLLDRVLSVAEAAGLATHDQDRFDYSQVQLQVPIGHPWRSHLVSSWKAAPVNHQPDCGCPDKDDTERLSLSVQDPFALNIAVLMLKLGVGAALVDTDKRSVTPVIEAMGDLSREILAVYEPTRSGAPPPRCDAPDVGQDHDTTGSSLQQNM